MLGQGKDKGHVFGYIVGKHLLFTMGPNANPNTVETVALYSNDHSNNLASAGFLRQQRRAVQGRDGERREALGHIDSGRRRAGAHSRRSPRSASRRAVGTYAGRMDARVGHGAASFSLKAPRGSTTDRVPPRSVRVVAGRRAALERLADARTASRRGCTARPRSTPPRARAAGSVARCSPFRASTSDRRLTPPPVPHVPRPRPGDDPLPPAPAGPGST